MDNTDFKSNPIKRLYSVMLFDTKNDLKIKPKNEEDLNTFVNYLNKDFTNGSRVTVNVMGRVFHSMREVDAFLRGEFYGDV